MKNTRSCRERSQSHKTYKHAQNRLGHDGDSESKLQNEFARRRKRRDFVYEGKYQKTYRAKARESL